MTTTIAHLIDIATGAAEPDDATERIRREREAVEAYLRDGGDRVYGFTTPPGNLDGRECDGAELLRAHIPDPSSPRRVNPVVLRLIAAVKAHHMSHGGTGVSEDVYRRIRDVARGAAPLPTLAHDPLSIPSYGSGDVACAAAWALAALGDIHDAGDVIAAINGNHIALATAIILAVETATDAADLAAEARFVTGGEFPMRPGDAQLPVSVRDATPVLDSARFALDTLATAIERALVAPSGNPLFTISDDASVNPRFTSSFLTFPLAQAARVVAYHHRTAMRYRVRWITHACAALEAVADAGVAAARFLWPPKVARDTEATVPAPPTTPAIAESGGVEDICDGAMMHLRHASTVLAASRDTRDMLLRVLLDAPPSDNPARDDAIDAVFTGRTSLPGTRDLVDRAPAIAGALTRHPAGIEGGWCGRGD